MVNIGGNGNSLELHRFPDYTGVTSRGGAEVGTADGHGWGRGDGSTRREDAVEALESSRPER